MLLALLPALIAFALPPDFRGRSAVDWARDLKSNSRIDRLKAILALREVADRWPEAVDAAGPMLADSDPVVRRIAADIQGRHAPMAAAAAARLARTLDDPQVEVRLAAAHSLEGARAHARIVVGPLSARLSDDDTRVRRLAAAVLAGFGHSAQPAVEALTEALGDADAETRTAVIEALRNIGPEARSAADALRRIVRADGDEADAAAEALNRILGARTVLVILDVSASMECVREFAQAQVMHALSDLDAHNRFDVVTCRNGWPYSFRESFVRYGEENARRLESLLDDHAFKGRTGVGPALVHALKSEPDEIVVITDGGVTDEETAELRRRNTTCGERAILIRVVALKATRDANLSAVRRLAACDSGSIEIVDLTFLEHRR